MLVLLPLRESLNKSLLKTGTFFFAAVGFAATPFVAGLYSGIEKKVRGPHAERGVFLGLGFKLGLVGDKK